MQRPPAIAQIKLHRHFGGGEVYARFLCAALDGLGHPNLILTHPRATYWNTLKLPAGTLRHEAATPEEAIRAIPKGIPVISHAPLPQSLLRQATARNPMSCIVHMPFTGKAEDFAGYERVFAVSEHVANSLRQRGVEPWPEPLLGVADFQRGSAGDGSIQRRSEFDWDQRKVRDRLLGLSESIWSRLRPQATYVRNPAHLNLCVVSRLTTIKKFPELFTLLAPIMAEFPRVRLELFGAGGYAQVRDTRVALRPLGERVRFWGHQTDITTIYRNVDCVLSGLPEREALGLNLIEAQQLGTPVIAVDAPPFTETVAHGVTGWLYRDPREDRGEDFRSLLRSFLDHRLELDRSGAKAHLQRFSMPAFMERVQRAWGIWLP